MAATGTPYRRRARQRIRLTAVASAGVLTALLATTAQAAESGWTATDSLTASRYDHTASRLADGRVLVAGGLTSWVTKDGFVRLGTLASAEVYDPATGAWKRTRPMSTARRFATSTSLMDGRVLVAGGRGDGAYEFSSAEIYDPKSGRWSAAAAMNHARAENLAVRLADGRVLVAGQRNVAVEGDREPTAEIYDPATNTWVVTGPTGAQSGCCNPRGVLLPDGRVLTTLGTSNQWNLNGGGPTVYDPATDTWSRLPAAPEFLGNAPQIALLSSGNVLFAGGWSTDFYANTWPTNVVAELDVSTGTWISRPASRFQSFFSGQSLTSLADGRVLASGGSGSADLDHVYDPAAGTWSSVAGVDRFRASVTLLADGRALTAGGFAGNETNALKTAEIFQP